MKKLLIIKTGTTFPSIRKNFGDFEDFIINQGDIQTKNTITTAIYKNEPLPELKDVSAIIITGSHSMVTENEKWSVDLAHWLKQLLYHPIPVLGICYGHQLLAAALGGMVGYHPKGKEIGTVAIELTDKGTKDLLLGVLPKKFLGHVTHAQTIINLPNYGEILAENEMEKHHSFSINKKIWGVQFHPEFNADITREYIHQQEDVLINEGYDIEKLYNSLQDHVYGELLLKRFISIIEIGCKAPKI